MFWTGQIVRISGIGRRLSDNHGSRIGMGHGSIAEQHNEIM
jgi:hypothetical protein